MISLLKLDNLINYKKDGGKKITAIVVEGNENISKDLIISQITSNLGDVFSKESIEKDVKAIYELGYFKDVRVKLESFREGYKVVFVAVENLAVKEINITGNTVVSKEEMKEVMVLQEGQIFSQKIFKNDLTRISQLYKDRGYLLINIKEVNFDEQGKLWITISEGYLEKILIEGNDKTKEKVITREITIQPGDLFDFEKVKKSLQKIYNLGYFEDVTMRLDPGSKENLVVLVIKIVEKSKIRNSINFLLKNVLALFFLLSVYIRLFLPKWFYKITDYLPSNINLFIKSYIFIVITFSFVIILSYFFLEKRFDRKNKLQYFIIYFRDLSLFPFIVFYKIIIFFFDILDRIIKLGSNVFKRTKNNLIQILLFLGDLVLIILIWGSSNNIVIIFSMFTVMISLIFHIDYFFNLVINPNLVYFPLYNFVEWIWNFRRKNVAKRINKKNDPENINIHKEWLKLFIKDSAKLFNMLKNIINIFYGEKGLLFAFIIFFMLSILFTVTIFSFEYYGLSKINNNNFNNLTEIKYFEYFYFSMTIYSTFNPGNIIPLTTISKLLVMLQILIGIVFFYIFIVSFQMVTLKLAAAGKQEILKRIETNLNYLNKLSEREFSKNLNNL